MRKKIIFIVLTLVIVSLLFLLGSFLLRKEYNKGYDEGIKECELINEKYNIALENIYEETSNSEKESEIYLMGYNDGLNDPMNYEKGYADGYEDCLMSEETEFVFAYYSGKFTAEVLHLLEDNYQVEGKSVAYLSSMFRPFIVYFDHDMTGELVEGKEYVFEIEPFSVPYVVGSVEYSFEEFAEKLRVVSFYEADENERGRNGHWIAAEYFKEDPLNNQ